MASRAWGTPGYDADTRRFERYVATLDDDQTKHLHRIVARRASAIYRQTSGFVQEHNYRQYRETKCGIRDCERAMFRAGLCRKHHAMLPPENAYARAAEQMMVAARAGAERRAAIVSDLQERLDSEARG